jgi:hypothetical protein
MDTDEAKSVWICYRDGQPTSMLSMVYVQEHIASGRDPRKHRRLATQSAEG